MKFIKYTVVISLFLLISCDPCPEEIDCPNPFTDEELQWLPYLKGDKLVFLELNSSDSLIYDIHFAYNIERIYTDEYSPYCRSSCIYISEAEGKGTFTNDEEYYFGFEMIKSMKGFKLNSIASGQYGVLKRLFILEEAIHLDSLLVNGQYLKNVYKYITYPMQEIVAETYMHQGMGLVKIKFRDGQDFELAEHIKSNN